MILRKQVLFVALCTGLAVVAAILMPRIGHAQAEPPGTLTGKVTILWVDSFVDGNLVAAPPIVTLTDATGAEHLLDLTPELAAPYGGLEALQGRQVKVAVGATAAASPADAGLPVVGVSSVEAGVATPLIGNERWVMLLCRAAESAVVVPDPLPHYAGLWANAFPGMDHHWREVSYGQYSVAGSRVFGWYDLPQAGSAYWEPVGNSYRLQAKNVKEDCSAAADADVYFPDYAGVVFVVPLPEYLNGWWALGGGARLNRDGVDRYYRSVYMPREIGHDEVNYSVLTEQWLLIHEMGHGLGLPHSSGPYQKTYDSAWDFMSGRSAPGLFCEVDATYGCVGPHTIAYHKDRLGWIAPAQKVVVAPGSAQMVSLARLARPRLNMPLFVQIPLTTDGTQFYTVEARGGGKYEKNAPEATVVLHSVDTSRPDRKAQVVDPDGNGNPNDAAAQWVPGETFTDGARNVRVCVEAKTDAGYLVGVGNRTVVSCPFTPHFETTAPFGSFSRYPVAGEIVDMYLEMTNGGTVAAGVVATITLPAGLKVLTETVDSFDGTILSTDPIVLRVGTLGYDDYDHVYFQAQVDPELTEPAALESAAEISWVGGMLRQTYVQIANARFLHLPMIRK